MIKRKLAVIGIGNMAKAVIAGVVKADLPILDITVYDKNTEQYNGLPRCGLPFRFAETIRDAVAYADCVLLAVKPQNYDEVLAEISDTPLFDQKLYISIAAGITSDSVSERLGHACVIRVLPNVPMLIGQGVSVICENSQAEAETFEFICSIFRAAGSILLIDESEINRIIGVTSSSPAYVFRFIQAIYRGALAQGVSDCNLLDAICDVVIGSALMLKNSHDSPEELIAKVASKGGTTERALNKLNDCQFDEAIKDAMKACTVRADELGALKKQ